jgi:hypothetical protein
MATADAGTSVGACIVAVGGSAWAGELPAAMVQPAIKAAPNKPASMSKFRFLISIKLSFLDFSLAQSNAHASTS